MTATRNLTTAEQLLAIAEVQARRPEHRGDVEPYTGPEPDPGWVSDWTADRIAQDEENAQERQWRWFE